MLTIILSLKLLHQGAQLKNTREVYGVCVYAGSQTKIHLNSKITHNKFSTVERSLNRYLLAFVLILIIELAVSTVLTLTYGIEYVNSTPYSNTINGILNRPAGKIPHEYLCFCGRDLDNALLMPCYSRLDLESSSIKHDNHHYHSQTTNRKWNCRNQRGPLVPGIDQVCQRL